MLLVAYLAKTLSIIRGYISYIFLFLLIIYREEIISWFLVILTSLRIIYFIDWNFFIENYVMDASVFFMEGEGEGSDQHKFKKPGFPHNEGNEPSKASVGEKRQLDDNNSDELTIYTRDDGTQISSKKPKDWGIDNKHKFSNERYLYKYHCTQMANILEYHNKVYGRVLVSTCFDPNPFLNYDATEFFDNFTEPRNLSDAPMSDKLANNLELRNLFRSEANKK